MSQPQRFVKGVYVDDVEFTSPGAAEPVMIEFHEQGDEVYAFPRTRDEVFEALKAFWALSAERHLEADVMHVPPAMETLIPHWSTAEIGGQELPEKRRSSGLPEQALFCGCRLVFDAPSFRLENSKTGFTAMGFPPVLSSAGEDHEDPFYRVQGQGL